jgi:hypothetical protein
MSKTDQRNTTAGPYGTTVVSFEDNITGMEKEHTILDPQLTLKLYTVYTPPPLPFTKPRINRGKQGNNRTKGGGGAAIEEQLLSDHYTYKHPKCAYFITLCFNTDFSIRRCRNVLVIIEIPRIGKTYSINCLVLASLHKALKIGRIVRCVQEFLTSNFLGAQFINFSTDVK